MSYAQKAVAPVPSKASLENITASQLVQLLRSFGLSVVAAAPPPVSAAASVASSSVMTEVNPSPSVPCLGGEEASAHSTSIPEEITPAAAIEAAAAGDKEGDDGWTVVRGRRTARRRSGSPPHPAAHGEPSGTTTTSSGSRSRVEETAVMAALRRNDEDKRARDARRARLVERVREARRSPGAESDSGAAGPVPLRTAAPPAVNPAERPPSSLLGTLPQWAPHQRLRDDHISLLRRLLMGP